MTPLIGFTIYFAIGLLFFNYILNYKPRAHKFIDEKAQRQYDQKCKELRIMVNDLKAVMASNAGLAILVMIFMAMLWPIPILGGLFKK